MVPSNGESHFTAGSPEQLTWRWRLLGADGVELRRESVPGFSSRGDAETWIGEVWRDLSEDGVHAATLLDGDRVVYGPMPLEA